jgi:Helix-turn-helix
VVLLVSRHARSVMGVRKALHGKLLIKISDIAHSVGACAAGGRLKSVPKPRRVNAGCGGMEQQGLTREDLEPAIGTRTRVAEVLNRKRSLSIGMIRRLHARLGISAEVLIRPSRGKSG